MRAIKRTRNIAVRELVKYLGEEFEQLIPVIPAEETTLKEEYPYISYNFIAPHIPFSGQGNFEREIVDSRDKDFKHDVIETRITQPSLSMTFNAHSRDKMETFKVAKKAADFFEHAGRQHLSDENISVVSLTNFGDRTINIVDHYEHRAGFDIELRRVDKVHRRVETIEKGHFEYEDIDINFLKEAENEEFK